MSKIVVNTNKAPGAIGPYSQGIKANGFVFTSGILPLNPQTGAVVGSTVEEQTEQVMHNIAAILEEAGSGFDKIVKATVYITDFGDFAAMNGVYGKYFKSECPARSCVEIGKLAKNAMVEIEVGAIA